MNDRHEITDAEVAELRDALMQCTLGPGPTGSLMVIDLETKAASMLQRHALGLLARLDQDAARIATLGHALAQIDRERRVSAARIATLERERDDAYSRGKRDGMTEENHRAIARIATLEAAVRHLTHPADIYECEHGVPLTETCHDGDPCPSDVVRAALRGGEGKP